MENSIGVGLGEIVVSRNSEDVLVAYGLGSCLGIGIYDPRAHVAGLLHAVLPEQMNGSTPTSTKFVDIGIPRLIEQMLQAGASREGMLVRMAGGANMLVAPGLSKTFDIGPRNIAAARLVLEHQRLRLAAQDVGGNTGRTVRLYVASGKMTVRVIGGIEKEL